MSVTELKKLDLSHLFAEGEMPEEEKEGEEVPVAPVGDAPAEEEAPMAEGDVEEGEEVVKEEEKEEGEEA